MDSISQFRDALVTSLAKWGLHLTADQVDQLATHYRRLVEVNQTCNLTRITDPIDSAVLHYADSLALLACPLFREAKALNVLDIGSGAGFPAVPLAIVRPDWRVTALDSTLKKVSFVDSIREELGLQNLACEHAHTTHYQAGRTFELVVTRAFGALVKCLESGAPMVANGGWIVSFKTPRMSHEETGEANRVSRALRLAGAESFTYELDLRGEIHERLLDIRRFKQ